jgi:hypothetical protein
LDLYKLIGREGNRFSVENQDGEKLRRRLKPSEIQVIKAVDNNIDREVIKTQAKEKKSRQTINKLVRGSEMTKQEASKAVEDLNNNDKRSTRERKEVDYITLNKGEKLPKPTEIKIIKKVNKPKQKTKIIEATEKKVKPTVNKEALKALEKLNENEKRITRSSTKAGYVPYLI